MTRCPRCTTAFDRSGRRGRGPCSGCGTVLAVDAAGFDVLGDDLRPASFGAAAMQSRWLARAYDRLWRPVTFALSTAFGAPSRDVEARTAVACLGVRPGPWLDLSCGTGWLSSRLVDVARREGRGREVFALDTSRPMLERAHAAAPGAVLVRADAAALPFDDAVFAGVVNFAALDLYPAPERVIADSARVLQRGGRWVCSSFVVESRRGRARPRPRPGSRPPTIAEIEGWAEAAGLADFHTRRFRGYAIAWADKR